MKVPTALNFQVQSALFCIKGKIYEALDNRNFATDCYREALRNDVHCYDAFQALIQHQMLTSFEGWFKFIIIDFYILKKL